MLYLNTEITALTYFDIFLILKLKNLFSYTNTLFILCHIREFSNLFT